MSEDNFFVAFHNMQGNEIMRLGAKTPGSLMRKMLENSEAINSLTYDHHTTNVQDLMGDDKNE